MKTFLKIWLKRQTNTEQRLVEDIAETDEELMEKYLGGEEITIEELKTALRKACISL